MRLHIGAAILIVPGVIFLLINLDIAPAAELKKLPAHCSSRGQFLAPIDRWHGRLAGMTSA